MTTDPKPLHTLGNRRTKRAIVKPNSYAAILAVTDRFELQGRMRCIALKQCKVFMRKLLHVKRQCRQALPEAH